MISVSRFKVIRSKSNVRVSIVVVFARNCSLVDDSRLKAVSVKWAFVLLSAVACFCFVSGVCTC